VLLKTTNLSRGISTPYIWKSVATPWILPDELIRAINKGPYYPVDFKPLNYVADPSENYGGEEVYGVMFNIRDKNVNPINFIVQVLWSVYILYPNGFQWDGEQVERYFGNTEIVQFFQSQTPGYDIIHIWEREIVEYLKQRKEYFLYE
jgi:uncharacterized protein YbbC (DUF1343 family)